MKYLRRKRVVAALAVTSVVGLSLVAVGQVVTAPDPVDVRTRATAAGLRPLSTVPIPAVAGLGDYVRDPEAAAVLGKALFWDMQVGSDGQACASCHFHAGVDNRVQNQLNPGRNNADLEFGDSETGAEDFASFGPNSTLTEADFPLRTFSDPGVRRSEVLRDSDDVVSSQGVFNGDFRRMIRGDKGELGTTLADPIFSVQDVNVRRVEPRHTPSMINAVFNFHNFWDGRAHNLFNGASPLGPVDQAATVLVVRNGALQAERVRLPNSSLASQAVGPPLSNFEMVFNGRSFPLLGRKLVSRRPLELQLVHPTDSLLGPLARARSVSPGKLTGERGLNTTYEALIKKAFRPELWDSKVRVAFDAQGNRIIPAPTNPKGESFSLMESNFSLFFGLAVQLYETKLISDQTRFDDFLAGNDSALSSEELEGLNVFIGRGGCSACHAGAELTLASVTLNSIIGQTLALPTLQVDANGVITINGGVQTFEDTGFFNIGVRPTAEDPGRAGTAPDGTPLSPFRRFVQNLPESPQPPPCPLCVNNRSTGIDGSFKAPSLRNVELTGPYFHNGGQATLGQVVDFYRRQGDFADRNIESLSLGMALINLQAADRQPLVKLLVAMTDERVRQEQAPFDHPQLLVPNGHPGDADVITCTKSKAGPTTGTVVLQACDDLLEVPAVGAQGRPAANLPPLKSFLELDPLD